MQKHVNIVDLVKSFPTNIFLENFASRTSPVKFAHLAEKSGKGSISNLSTKVRGAHVPRAPARDSSCGKSAGVVPARGHDEGASGVCERSEQGRAALGAPLRSEVNSELNFCPNFEGLVLGCIDADFCK